MTYIYIYIYDNIRISSTVCVHIVCNFQNTISHGQENECTFRSYQFLWIAAMPYGGEPQVTDGISKSQWVSILEWSTWTIATLFCTASTTSDSRLCLLCLMQLFLPHHTISVLASHGNDPWLPWPPHTPPPPPRQQLSFSKTRVPKESLRSSGLS